MSLKVSKRKGSPFLQITGTINKRRIRESAETANPVLAKEIAAARHVALVREALYGKPASRRTFTDVVASYIEHAGPHTEDTKAKVRRLLAFFGEVKADDVDQAAVDRACTALLRASPSPATRLRQIISPARAVLVHGAKRRMCATPIFDTGKASPSRTEWLPPDEMDRLLQHAAPHLRPLLAFLTGTGARLGEALALDWCDVDLRHARATLRDTKNGTDRTVDLCPRVLAGLLFDPREKQRRGAARLLSGRVFLTRSGRPYAERRVQGGGQIKTGWAAALRRGRISRPVTPHSCRHTWASWHYAEHRDLLLLQTKGGWSSITMVTRYAHVVPPSMTAEILAWRVSGTLVAHATPTAKKALARTTA